MIFRSFTMDLDIRVISSGGCWHVTLDGFTVASLPDEDAAMDRSEQLTLRLKTVPTHFSQKQFIENTTA